MALPSKTTIVRTLGPAILVTSYGAMGAVGACDRVADTVHRRDDDAIADDAEGHQESEDTGPTGSMMAFVRGANGAGEPQSSIASTLTVATPG
jgi:hypothetical protein